MASVGERLRQAREQRGVTLPQLSAQTRINPHYLEAIEADRPESLPGRFFYKSFVQQYARAVGIAEEEIRRDLEHTGFAEVAPAAVEPERTRMAPTASPLQPIASVPGPLGPAISHTPSRLGPRLVLFAVVLAVCTGLYATWDWLQNRSTIAASTPPSTAHDVPAETPAKATATRAEPPVRHPTAELPATRAEKPAPEQTASAAHSAGAAAAPAGPIAVTVSADEPTWFRVVADGKQVFNGVLRRGESKSFSSLEKASLRAGNAGGIKITYNGKPIGTLGPRGQICTVVFTPERFEIQSSSRNESGAPPGE